MTFLDPLFNPILQPLLNWSPFWAVVLISLIISVLITLAYKVFTNQEEMKRLKEKQKEFQQRMKELRNNPEQMMAAQKENMQISMQYMKQSLRVTLITMLPILLIFTWMNAHLSSEPIFPNERYEIIAVFAEGVTGEAELIPDAGTQLFNEAQQEIQDGTTSWTLSSVAGEHNLTVKHGNDQQTKEVLITTELQYAEAVQQYQHSDITQIQINYDKLTPLGTFSIFGWEPGWLGLYIIFSLLFSIGLRKVMKVY